MGTSRTTSLRSDKPIASSEMSFIGARNRQQAYDLLVREFKKSGLSQAELARRVDMPPEVISRMLKRPRNVEIDTLSKLIYGLTGAALVFGTALPMELSETSFARAAGLIAKPRKPTRALRALMTGKQRGA